MRIGVIADTHLTRPELPARLFEAFRGVDLIVHAGDICVSPVLGRLRDHAPTLAVWGNNDDSFLMNRLPEMVSFSVGRFTVQVLHGHQMRTAQMTAERAAAGMSGPGMVIFGHSHQVVNESRGDIVLLNPGTPTLPRFSRRRTAAVVEIRDEIVVNIINLNNGP